MVTGAPIRLSSEDGDDPFTLGPRAGAHRALQDVLADLGRADDAGAGWVRLVGHAAARHPAIDDIARAVRARSASAALVGLASDLDLTALPASIEVLEIPLHGAAARHDALVGRPGDWLAAVRLLHGDTGRRVRVVATVGFRRLSSVLDQIPHLRDHAEALILRPDPEDPAPSRHVASFLDRVVAMLRGSQTAIVLADLHVPPDPRVGPTRPRDALTVSVRAQGGWLPGLLGGVRAPADPAAASRDAAMGLGPAVAGSHPPLRGRVIVLAPFHADLLVSTSTLPALAAALRARGVDATLESAWDPPWNLFGPDPLGRGETLPPLASARTHHRHGQRMATAQRLAAPFLAHADLRGADAVIVPDAATALAIAPRLPAHAHLHVLDLHLLERADALAALLAGPRGDAVTVHSAFPGFAPLFEERGVPLRQVVWRPWPVHLADLPGGAVDAAPLPAPSTAAWAASAGNHARQLGLLVDAVGGRPLRHPIRVHSADPTPLPAPLEHLGQVPLGDLADTLAGARYVALPVLPMAHRAAGVTVLALARAMGRPVVASASWGTLDALVHGVDSVLLPHDEPDLWADVLTRLDADDALVDGLGAGARWTRTHATPDAWADGMVAGVAAPWPLRTPPPPP
jgi:hypothetical protein